jgi:hypothetical protein
MVDERNIRTILDLATDAKEKTSNRVQVFSVNIWFSGDYLFSADRWGCAWCRPAPPAGRHRHMSI